MKCPATALTGITPGPTGTSISLCSKSSISYCVLAPFGFNTRTAQSWTSGSQPGLLPPGFETSISSDLVQIDVSSLACARVLQFVEDSFGQSCFSGVSGILQTKVLAYICSQSSYGHRKSPRSIERSDTSIPILCHAVTHMCTFQPMVRSDTTTPHMKLTFEAVCLVSCLNRSLSLKLLPIKLLPKTQEMK